jgi:hypothetical protein
VIENSETADRIGPKRVIGLVRNTQFGQIASHDLALVAVVFAAIMAVLAAAWFVLRRRSG